MSVSRPVLLCALTAAAAAAAMLSAAAQSAGRVATTIDVLARFPGVFHGRPVAIVAQAADVDRSWRLPIDAPRTFLVVPRTGAPPGQTAEFRGVFFDLGRLNDEGGLATRAELQGLVQAIVGGQPLARDRVFGLTDATWTDPPTSATASLRNIVLNPSAFDGKTVTVRGRFRGQNLFGDVPFWPRQSRWDFVIQSADASLWVTDLRPRGQGFELDPSSRRDAATWFEVSGVMRTDGGMPRIQGSKIARSTAEAEPAPEPVAARPPEPPPTVIFSAPLNGETAVPVGAIIRVQFSRNMAPASFQERVRVAYAADVTDPMPGFTVIYRPENRALEVRLAAPLVGGATVNVELTSGITASDGTPLAPAKISFMTQR
jgi:hypothetical protein